MKKYFLICATLFCFGIQAQNPTFLWAKQTGNPGLDLGSSVTADASGNVFTTGFFTGVVDFDPGAGTFMLASTGNRDIFLSKLDAAGNFVWAKKIGSTGDDEGASVTLDGSGNVLVTGYFSGSADFDPGVGTFTMSSTGGADIFAVKLDAAGNFIWAGKMGSSAADEGVSLTSDASGNVYTTGYFNNGCDFDPGAGTYTLASTGANDIFVSKLSASGNFIWAKKMGSSSLDQGNSIKVDASGNVITAGRFAGTADFDPAAPTYDLTSAGNDVFVSKLDASGNFVWAKQMGGTSGDNCTGLVLDGSGNIYTTGAFQVVADFDPGAGTFTLSSLGGNDIFVSKLDASGNFVWAKQLGGTGAGSEVGFAIALDAFGNVHTCGYFQLTVDFDPGAGTFNLTSAGGEDVFLSKLDASGNFLWAKQMGGTSSDEALSIAIDGLGGIYSTGYFSVTGDFDPGIGIFNLTSAGSFDIFIHKMAWCSSAPSQPGPISGLTVMCLNNGTTSYSIATVVGATSYSWVLPGGWSGTSSTNTISVTPGSSGMFSVTASNICGPSSFQTLSVTVNPLPTINASTSNTMLCIGQSATLTASGASSYTFNPGGAGTSIVVSPSLTSTYTINGTGANGCTNSSTFTQSVSTCAGIKTFEETLGLVVYPNPTTGKITISYKINWIGFGIYNSLGEKLQINKVFGKESVEVDLSAQPEGIYFIKVGSVTRKIIKQ
jgi:hypothetical protein